MCKVCFMNLSRRLPYTLANSWLVRFPTGMPTPSGNIPFLSKMCIRDRSNSYGNRNSYCARCVILFLFTMMWTLWGPGSRPLFWLGRLPTAQACRLFACPATRRPVHIKPWQKLVNQYHNAHHCNPSTVYRGFGPSVSYTHLQALSAHNESLH